MSRTGTGQILSVGPLLLPESKNKHESLLIRLASSQSLAFFLVPTLWPQADSTVCESEPH